jgi:hypothetical protein
LEIAQLLKKSTDCPQAVPLDNDPNVIVFNRRMINNNASVDTTS